MPALPECMAASATRLLPKDCLPSIVPLLKESTIITLIPSLPQSSIPLIVQKLPKQLVITIIPLLEPALLPAVINSLEEDIACCIVPTLPLPVALYLADKLPPHMISPEILSQKRAIQEHDDMTAATVCRFPALSPSLLNPIPSTLTENEMQEEEGVIE